jgi:hypothetical protein
MINFMARKSGPSDPSNLMDNSARAIVHLRAQRHRKRLGLIFGAGASKALGFPGWEELVHRIANHEEVQAREVLDRAGEIKPPRSLAALTHMMFDHFRVRKLGGAGLDTSVPLLQEQRIKSDWLRIIHTELYRDVPKTAEERKSSIEAHSYLKSFLDVIKASPLTVNYNFDDTIEKLLMFSRNQEEEDTTRGYETIDKPNAQFQKPAGVIYHPNGFLPSRFDDGASADLVFDSDGFQDQLISAANGRYVHLSNHLSRNTCLLIGLSLDDTTLQSMLRQNAVTSPGHIHYFVHFVPAGAPLSEETRKTVFDSNFTSYNLYTLFLDADGIRNLADLIRMSDSQFVRFQPNSRKLVYYVVGSIGAGKSTAASNFRSLITYDEWIDERLPELARPQSAEDDASSIDSWIAEQFRKKNYALSECKEGIHLVDRCPLDPLTFPGDKQAKATNLLTTMTHESAMTIAQGHVIMLDCDLDELKHRNSLKHKYWDDDKLSNLINEIDLVYRDVPKTVLCTRGRSIDEVAREIARIIFLADYKPVDIGAELQKHCGAVCA